MAELALAATLVEKLRHKRAKIGVIGCGYVGLPLAREFCHSGFQVIGFDTDSAKVTLLNSGESYIRAVPTIELKDYLSRDLFEATADFDRLAELDAMLICVPTPLNQHREPDMSYIASTAHSIAKRLKQGQLVVLESTTYPGTTDEFLRAILESESQLKVGQDCFLAYSPERENPGDKNWRTRDIPKVVGADDDASRATVKALYENVVTQVVPVSSSRAAEASKLLENIYRCVNIALVNELKVLFERMNIDIFEVIGASKTKPFGFKAFYPGPGMGGHCIPVDPFYLSWKAREYETPTRFIELAGEVNTEMPQYVVERCILALNEDKKSVNGSKILILGVAYKENVDDVRESPALTLMKELRKLGAELSYHDSFIPQMKASRIVDLSDYSSVELSNEFVADQDLVLIVTAHSDVDYQQLGQNAKLIVDTRNAMGDFHEDAAARIVRA
ncbi:MAG: nucleotide sugar dehydrogenase [Planctomycetota bacterium]|nr:nucleotide sugar dehydrogenase [Planctomycetota bacterium]